MIYSLVSDLAELSPSQVVFWVSFGCVGFFLASLLVASDSGSAVWSFSVNEGFSVSSRISPGS